jgi:hypothetical protein
VRLTTELSVLGLEGRLGASDVDVVDGTAGFNVDRVDTDEGIAGLVDERATVEEVSSTRVSLHRRLRCSRYHVLTYLLMRPPSPRAWVVRRLPFRPVSPHEIAVDQVRPSTDAFWRR